MGFLDKAKQMAKDFDVEKAKQQAKQAMDQAQAKVDEVQGNFNAKQQQAGEAAAGPSSAAATEYDKHGRPIAADAAPPAGEHPAPPAAAEAVAPPAAPEAGSPAAEGDAPAAPQAAPAEGQPAPTAPKKPPAMGDDAPAGEGQGEYAPKPMTSGDPLAG